MTRAMKDSGIGWIGIIPQDWRVNPLKTHIEWKSIKNHENDQVLSLYRDYGVIPKDSRDDNYNVTSLDTSGYKYVEVGDLVVNKMKAWQGSIAVSDYSGIVSPAYHVCKITDKNICSRFLHYLLRNQSYLPEYKRLSTGMRVGQWDLSFDDFKNLPIVLPRLKEQILIAGFLDKQCALIDNFIEKTRASIEEYKKLKLAIITNAVTKGVRGNRPMKDSGIKWFGEIPEEWGFTKVLHSLSMPITDGPHTTPDLLDDGIVFISAEAVSCGNGKIDFSHKRGYISQEFYDECCKKYVPLIDDIYMIKSGATTGKVSIVDTLSPKFTIWSPLAVFRCDVERMLPLYLFYQLQSFGFQKQVELGWTYGTQQNIGMRTLEQLKICIPPMDEQREIVDYLSNKCASIDNLVQEKEQQIIEIENYRKSMIYEFVTGKKEVVV